MAPVPIVSFGTSRCRNPIDIYQQLARCSRRKPNHNPCYNDSTNSITVKRKDLGMNEDNDRTSGLTDEEISAVKTIVMAVSAGRVMMQFDEVLNNGAGGCPEDDGCDD